MEEIKSCKVCAGQLIPGTDDYAALDEDGEPVAHLTCAAGDFDRDPWGTGWRIGPPTGGPVPH